MTKGMPTQLVFEYLQAGSGSKIKRVVNDAVSTGTVDAYVTIAAEDYAKHGRVLAWRASVKRGGKTIASKQSYMWR